MMLSRDFLVDFGQGYVLADLEQSFFDQHHVMIFLVVISRDYFFINVVTGLYLVDGCDFFMVDVVKSIFDRCYLLVNVN